MIVREYVALSTLTTLKVGGTARFVLTARTPEDIPTVLAFVRERGLPLVVLGQGSNVLAADAGYDGAVVLMHIPGIAYEEQGETTLVHAGAGVSWDELVDDVASRGLWGIENLAGIPGTVGAAPVQNIGAYGMELAEVLKSVEAFDTGASASVALDRDACGFGYRDSRFKQSSQLIITSVTLVFTKHGQPRLDYADLAAAKVRGEDLSTPGAIGRSVRAIRAQKFPDLAAFGTAGSFFKNPILTTAQFAQLAGRYGAIPSYPQGNGVKVPLAFILDRVLGLRGYQRGPTFLFGNQPLVLVADHGARAEDVDALAREIEERVHEATGIAIEREVRMLDAHETK